MNLKKIFSAIIALFYLVIFGSSCSLFIYLCFLQVNTTISQKRLLGSFIVGFSLALAALFPLVKAVKQKRISQNFIFRSFLVAFLFCGILWLLVPMPTNYLFAKQGNFDVLIHRIDKDENGITQINYLSSGLDYIPARLLLFNPETAVSSKNDKTTLVFDSQGNAHFLWYGRSWKEILISLSTTQPVDIRLKSLGNQYQYHLDSNAELTIKLPILSEGYYIFAQLLVFIASILATSLLFALLGLIQKRTPSQTFDSEITWSWENKLVVFVFLIVFALISIGVVIIGFKNRLYSDDYCYIFELKKAGFFKAVSYYMNNLNGRFSSHFFDFLAFEFPSINTVIGPLTSTILIGGGLYFFFLQLLRQYRRNIRLMLSALFSTMILGSTYLVVPYLYESFIWNLHSIIVSGGFCLFILACSFFLKSLEEKGSFRHKLPWGFVFFFLGVTGAGFNEVTTALNIVICGCLGIVLIYKKNYLKFRTTLINILIYILGSVIGMVFMIGLPGNSVRMSSQLSLNIAHVLSNFYGMIQSNTALIFNSKSILPLVLIVVLLAVAYYTGKTLPLPLQWTNQSIPFFEKVLLIISPFLLFFSSFFPLAFFQGYLPLRTLAIPICYTLTEGFLVAFIIGNSRRQFIQSNKAMAFILPVLLLIVCILSFKYLIGLSHQMILFDNEWDTRNQQIVKAIAQGKQEYIVTPYQYTPGTDLSNQSNAWLGVCENNYYGIKLIINDK